MQCLNRVFLIGHLTADPDSKTTENGHTLTTFSMATNRPVKHENGEKEQVTQFHRIVAWRKLGDLCAKSLTKGSLVLVEGEILYRSYKDDDDKTRHLTEIKADRVTFLRIKKDKLEVEETTGEVIED
ncbi:MAG: single-stranded DNA-binding protein [Patescibacteria group bacterium]|nr:single-stranded DNA-binding protein [Patescibacteria group bacterium]